MMWFHETLYGSVIHSCRVERLLADERTPHQRLQIFDTELWGRTLVLDGIIQTSEADEFIYHEMIAHVPLLAHGAAERVLIIGGGDGGCLEEVLKHPVEEVTMVELDRRVVELCREHLSSICGSAFEDERTRLVIGDGLAHVAEARDAYDVIIVDSTDPIEGGPGEMLFGPEFFADCRAALRDGGVLVNQNAVPFYHPRDITRTHRATRQAFRHAGFYRAAVPSFSGGDTAFAWASDAHDLAVAPDAATLEERLARAGFATRYYTSAMHHAAFTLPPCVQALLAQ